MGFIIYWFSKNVSVSEMQPYKKSRLFYAMSHKDIAIFEGVQKCRKT